MKRIAQCGLALCLAAAPLVSQEAETLVGDKVAHGGFGGPVLRFGEFNGQAGFMLGGHGGWIIDHRFAIGGAGYGLLGRHIDVPYASPTGGNAYLTFGYGGLQLQYFERPLKLVHLAFSALIGVGGAEYRQDGGGQLTPSSTLFVAEPGAGVALNLTPRIRVSVSGSYRIVSGVGLAGLRNADLSGPAAALSLDFASPSLLRVHVGRGPDRDPCAVEGLTGCGSDRTRHAEIGHRVPLCLLGYMRGARPGER